MNKPKVGLSFFELREGRCKFPLGNVYEPATRFCGDDAQIGCPYCAAHSAIASQPATRSSDRRAPQKLLRPN